METSILASFQDVALFMIQACGRLTQALPNQLQFPKKLSLRKPGLSEGKFHSSVQRAYPATLHITVSAAGGRHDLGGEAAAKHRIYTQAFATI